MPNKLIDIVGVSKSYGDNLVLDDLNLYIRENEFLTLLGPSGCGKTTCSSSSSLKNSFRLVPRHCRISTCVAIEGEVRSRSSWEMNPFESSLRSAVSRHQSE